MKKKLIPGFVVISSDAKNFPNELEKVKKQVHHIKEKHITTQIAQVANPAAQLKGLSTGQPDFITVALINAAIFFEIEEGNELDMQQQKIIS